MIQAARAASSKATLQVHRTATKPAKKIQFQEPETDLQEQVEKLHLYRETNTINLDADSASEASTGDWNGCPEDKQESFNNFKLNENFTLRDLLVGSLPTKKPRLSLSSIVFLNLAKKQNSKESVILKGFVGHWSNHKFGQFQICGQV